MDTTEASQLAVQRLREGRSLDEVVGELVAGGADAAAARELVSRLVALRDTALARERAVDLFKAGKSKAEVWEALVAGGLEAGAATALVTEVAMLKTAADAEAREPPVTFKDSGAQAWMLLAGVVLVALGLVVSLGTATAASRAGGGAILLWGPVVFGVGLIVRGLGIRR
jgi:hypothetical protein